MKRYKGYTNFETWCVNKHLTETAEMSQKLRKLVRDDIPAELVGFILMTGFINHFELSGDKLSLTQSLLKQAQTQVDWCQIVSCNLE